GAPADWSYQLATTRPARETIGKQKLMLEPLDTPMLFAAQTALWLRGPMASLHRDTYTSVVWTGGAFKRRAVYSVWSDLSVPNEQELRAETLADLPDDLKRIYVQQLPRKLDPRIRQEAHRVVHDAEAVTPFDKAKAIETYLK